VTVAAKFNNKPTDMQQQRDGGHTTTKITLKTMVLSLPNAKLSVGKLK
jgi:hypothetical protein